MALLWLLQETLQPKLGGLSSGERKALVGLSSQERPQEILGWLCAWKDTPLSSPGTGVGGWEGGSGKSQDPTRHACATDRNPQLLISQALVTIL